MGSAAEIGADGVPAGAPHHCGQLCQGVRSVFKASFILGKNVDANKDVWPGNLLLLTINTLTIMKTETKRMVPFIAGAICMGALLPGSLNAVAQNIFVGNYNSILEFSPKAGSTVFAEGLNYVRSLAFDSAGDLFEADCYSGQIFEFVNRDGVLSSSPICFAAHLDNPGAMAFNKAGDLFVASDMGNFIYKFAAGSTTPAIYVDTGLSSPQGLAFDSHGNMYVANWTEGTITKITPQKVQSTFASGLNQPCGLAFDATGNLFVANTSPYNVITEISPDDVQSTFVTGLNNPQGIAFDSKGNLFVTDDGTQVNRAELIEIAPDKTEKVISSSVGNPLGLAIQGQVLPGSKLPALIVVEASKELRHPAF